MGLSTSLGGQARLRGLLWLALTDIGHVEVRTSTSDSGGGATQTWAAGYDVPCRLAPITGGEGLAADRISDRSTHLITTPADTGASLSDRFVIEDRGTFEITALHERTGQLAQIFEAVEVL